MRDLLSEVDSHMKTLIASLVLLSAATCALYSQQLPIRCEKRGVENGCTMTYFDRAKNEIWDSNELRPSRQKPRMGPDPGIDKNYIAIIRGAGTKVLYSGTILDATYSLPSPLDKITN
jgi:hypothetical protein